MRPMTLLLPLVFTLACGDKDGDDTSASDDTAAGDADTDTDTDTDTDADTDSDAAFHAWGTYDDESFDVDCYFDDTDPSYTAGIQCQENIQFFLWCRPDSAEDNPGGLDVFQVWFNFSADYTSTGTHDLVGSGVLSVGDGMAAALTTTSENIESATVTVDSISLWTAAAGSFSAEWNDSGDAWAGDHKATLQGTFDFSCPTE
jgi:hypothetical protein